MSRISNTIVKRLAVYLIGMFFLSFGVSFSIEAGLGVSPVSSLAYAFALISGLSVGAMTIAANVLFILTQVILSKRFNLRESIVQLMIAFLFGFFIDLTLFIVRLLPVPETLMMQWMFLIISLFGVAFGLFWYTSAKMPLMPYDELTYVISERFKMKFGKAKIIGDVSSVAIAAILCLVFIQSFGSVGLGTVVSAYFVGKILGWFIKHYKHYLSNWMEEGEVSNKSGKIRKKAKESQALLKTEESFPKSF